MALPDNGTCLRLPIVEASSRAAPASAAHGPETAPAIAAHQRPKLERYDTTLFVVLRPARYLDEVEKVEFGEVHVFVGPDFVVTVRHAESPDLSPVRRRLERSPHLLRLGPEAVLYECAGPSATRWRWC